MAELRDTDIREAVRRRYATMAGCGCGDGFGDVLYAGSDTDGAPAEALEASLGCGVPTAVADLHVGALSEDEFRAALAAAGLVDVVIRPTHRVHTRASSAIVRARKP
jgi:hypothetical protein